MLDFHVPELRFAVEAVRRAAQLVQRVQAAMVSPVLTKEDRSPVTVADFSSQALISGLLVEAFPEDSLVAEEASAELRQHQSTEILNRVVEFVGRDLEQSTPELVCEWLDRGAGQPADRFWTLDPIDGTKGFLRGDQYAVALALLVDGQVQIGVLGCPSLNLGYYSEVGSPGSVVVAVRNEGAWVTPLYYGSNFVRLRVSERDEPSEARLLRSFEDEHTNVSQMDMFSHMLGVQTDPVCMDSQAKYAVLAAGQGDLYLRLLSSSKPNYREKIWDQTAGSLLVQEAGGCVTDLDGHPLDFSVGRTLVRNRGVLASNGILHEAALMALKKIRA
ncbi:MAG: 3'(2'),5'-bisphosphate nucleotidase [Chloroflexota bacterium]